MSYIEVFEICKADFVIVSGCRDWHLAFRFLGVEWQTNLCAFFPASRTKAFSAAAALQELSTVSQRGHLHSQSKSFPNTESFDYFAYFDIHTHHRRIPACKLHEYVMQVCSMLQVVFLSWNFCMLDPPLEPLSFSLSTFSYMGEQSGTETIPSRMEISLSSTELGWGCILRVAPEGWFRPAKKIPKKHGSTMAAWRHDHAPREPATKDSPNGCEQDRQIFFYWLQVHGVLLYSWKATGIFLRQKRKRCFSLQPAVVVGIFSNCFSSFEKHPRKVEFTVQWERLGTTQGNACNKKVKIHEGGMPGQVEWVRRSQSPTCPPSSVLRMHENDTGTTAHTFLVVLLGHLGRWWSLVVVVVVVANTPTHLAISWCQQRRDWIFTRGSLITIWLSR